MRKTRLFIKLGGLNLICYGEKERDFIRCPRAAPEPSVGMTIGCIGDMPPLDSSTLGLILQGQRGRNVALAATYQICRPVGVGMSYPHPQFLDIT